MAAEEAKQRGNEWFQQGEYGRAIDEYSRAIELAADGSVDAAAAAVYFLNRAASYLNIGDNIHSEDVLDELQDEAAAALKRAAAPQQDTSDAAAPQQDTSDAAPPQQDTSDAAAPQQDTSDAAAPQQDTSDAAAPQQDTSDAAAPQQAKESDGSSSEEEDDCEDFDEYELEVDGDQVRWLDSEQHDDRPIDDAMIQRAKSLARERRALAYNACVDDCWDFLARSPCSALASLPVGSKEQQKAHERWLTLSGKAYWRMGCALKGLGRIAAAQWAWSRYFASVVKFEAISNNERLELKRLREQLLRRKRAVHIVVADVVGTNEATAPAAPNAGTLVRADSQSKPKRQRDSRYNDGSDDEDEDEDHDDRKKAEDDDTEMPESERELISMALQHLPDAQVEVDRGVVHLPRSWLKQWQPQPLPTDVRVLLWAPEFSTTLSTTAALSNQLAGEHSGTRCSLELHLADTNIASLARSILLHTLATRMFHTRQQQCDDSHGARLLDTASATELLLAIEAIWCNWALFPWQKQMLDEALDELAHSASSLQAFSRKWPWIHMRGIDEFDQLVVHAWHKLNESVDEQQHSSTSNSSSSSSSATTSNKKNQKKKAGIDALEPKQRKLLRSYSSDNQAAVLLAGLRDQWLRWKSISLVPNYELMWQKREVRVTEVAGGRQLGSCLAEATPARILFDRFGFFPFSSATLGACSERVQQEYARQLTANTAALQEGSIMLRNPLVCDAVSLELQVQDGPYELVEPHREQENYLDVLLELIKQWLVQLPEPTSNIALAMHCWQAEATTLPRLVEDERRHLEAAKHRHTHTLDRYRKRDYQAALLDFGSMFPSAFDLVCTGSKAEYVGVINATVPFYSIVRNEQSIVRTFHALSRHISLEALLECAFGGKISYTEYMRATTSSCTYSRTGGGLQVLWRNNRPPMVRHAKRKNANQLYEKHIAQLLRHITTQERRPMLSGVATGLQHHNRMLPGHTIMTIVNLVAHLNRVEAADCVRGILHSLTESLERESSVYLLAMAVHCSANLWRLTHVVRSASSNELPNVVHRWQLFRRYHFDCRRRLPSGSALVLFVLVLESDEARRVAQRKGIDLYRWYCNADGNELQVIDSLDMDVETWHFSFFYPKYLMEEDGFGNAPTFLLVDVHRFEVLANVSPYLIE